MCEEEPKPRSSIDYGYIPFGEFKSPARESPLHRRAFSDRREYRRFRDASDSSNGPIAKRRRITPHPLFEGYQLVGDSLLLRFAEQVLFERCIYENGMRYLGLCVSGQTIDDLIRRVEENFSPLGEKIILLIGTNNLIQNKSPKETRDSLKTLLDLLEKTVKKIVILTIPPIPKLENNGIFWYMFNNYNRFIRLQSERKNVIVQDYADIYLNEYTECRLEYFEEWYDRAHRRPDLIHLNRAGLLEIRNHLLKSRVLDSDSEDEDEDSDEDSDEDCSSPANVKPNLDSD